MLGGRGGRAAPPPLERSLSSYREQRVSAQDAAPDGEGGPLQLGDTPVYELPPELTARLKELMPELAQLEGVTLIAHL